MANLEAAPAAPPPSLLPPRATADGTHRRLLEEALALFGQWGFNGVSVREIAKASGIRASSVYGHLESKEQLLFQLAIVGHEEHHDALRHALLEAGAEPVDQITRLVRAHVWFHATYPLLARVCNRELNALGPESQERVMAVRHQSEQLILDVIERGIRLGAFDVPQPWLAYAAIGSMGIRVAEWWGQLDFSVDAVADAYADYAVRLLVGNR
ncbi:MAG: TetR family transcriptional regulator [Acidimicrobiia bacterium]|nr:TetR family transcriptional regulator [Acidimicrobiia bacterium]